ncbi:MAG: formate dehydrogenase accessory sulfurtransferase FdhD [Candidatus Bathyarchaeia archaeon]
MSATARAKVLKVDLREGKTSKVEEEVAVESPVRIYINGRLVVTLVASPYMLDELAVGHLFSEGILKDKAAISEVLVAGTDIHVRLKDGARPRLGQRGLRRFITTACGSSADHFEVTPVNMKELSVSYSVCPEDIEQMVAGLNSSSRVFKATGGIHSAAIFQEMRMVAFSEDVGRHNAVDKAVGVSILKDVDFERSVLVTSGRQTADIVAKAARMRIPISVSISGPVDSGIRLAERAGLTLICFARGGRFNIYTAPERIRLSGAMLAADRSRGALDGDASLKDTS